MTGVVTDASYIGVSTQYLVDAAVGPGGVGLLAEPVDRRTTECR